MSTATAPSTSSLKETLLREVSVLPADYYPKVLYFIETLKADRQSAVRDWDNEDVDDWDDEIVITECGGHYEG